MLYRILTEDVNRDGISKVIASYTDGYTLIPAQGFWKGTPELSLVIELDGVSAPRAKAIAKSIKIINSQQAVLVQAFETHSVLV